MKTILLIGVGIIVLVAIVFIFVMAMGKSKKKAPPPPVLPKQYHDRYPKRSEFLQKGSPVDPEMPKTPDDKKSGEETNN